MRVLATVVLALALMLWAWQRNPASFNQDVSIRRDFRFGGRWKIGVGAEVFNLFNTVVFGGIQMNITSANFGRVTRKRTPRASRSSKCGSISEDRLVCVTQCF